MIRPIVLWPDPVLSKVADPVGPVTDEIRNLAQDMLDTMYDAPGRGLAAPQVGVSKRLFVMDTAWKDGPAHPRIVIDPVILERSDAEETMEEGCLSIPGVLAPISRPTEITLQWQDETGAILTERLTGFDAVCAQHELDHLDGIVTFDRLPDDVRADLEKVYSA